MNGVYDSINSFVEALNATGVSYLVLRNYENMLSPEIYIDGHGDIDLLCANSRLLAEGIGAMAYIDKVKKVCGDGIHYYIIIAGKHVSLDLRCVGDGYYCTKWQDDMLRRRIMKNGFYVMDEFDYVYSLIYHAILQKRTFSEEYRVRLIKMLDALKIPMWGDTLRCFVDLMECYMRKYGYVYTYPTDIFVPLRTKYINKRMLQKDFSMALKHWIFDKKVDTIEFLVNIKHLLWRN